MVVPATSLSEVEIALMDAIKSVALVVMAMNPGAAQALTTAFAHQRDGKTQSGQPAAAALFELLRRFAADPKQQEQREQILALMAAWKWPWTTSASRSPLRGSGADQNRGPGHLTSMDFELSYGLSASVTAQVLTKRPIADVQERGPGIREELRAMAAALLRAAEMP